MDEERVDRVKPLLLDVVNDIETCSIRLADAEDVIIYQGNNVLRLEQQIAELQLELQRNQQEQQQCLAEEEEAIAAIRHHESIVAGIGIR